LKESVAILLLLTALTAAVYARLPSCEFLHYDDGIYVTENLMVQRGISWEGVRWAFTATISPISSSTS
jgi:hypothetical protein